MMPERPQTLPAWLPYADLACATVAGGLWYAFPGVGPWPLVLALVPWGARYVLTGRLTRWTPFAPPLALFLLTAGVSVWTAYDRSVAWPKFWLIVGAVLLFYALVNAEGLAAGNGLGDVRAWLLAFFGAGVALYFLVTHDWDAYPAKIEALTRLGRALQAPFPALPGHRLNPNVAGGIMAMMVPYAVWATVQAWRGVRIAPRPALATRWLALAGTLVALALTFGALIMTTSRGAWLALAAAAGLAGLWLLSNWLCHDRPERRAWLFPLLLAGASILVLAVGIAWPGGLSDLVGAVPGPNTTLGRADLLRNGLTLVRDYPFLGAGLGGFLMLYSTYVLLLHVGFSVHTHNLFLNVAIEQGLLALFALAWMGLLFALAAWRGLVRPRTRQGAGMLGPAALSLIVVLVHGLVDDVLYGSRGVLLLFTPLAFAVPFLTKSEGHTARRWAVVAPILLVLFFGLALIGRDPLLSRVYSNLGAVRQSRVELGVYSWPEYPVQDAVRQQVDLEQAIADFERALTYDAHNATANRRLGMIELSMGRYEQALAHLEAAYTAEPDSVTARQLLGEALIANGRQEEGQALWAGVDNDQKQLDIRAYWYQSIGEEERAEWLRQAINNR